MYGMHGRVLRGRLRVQAVRQELQNMRGARAVFLVCRRVRGHGGRDRVLASDGLPGLGRGGQQVHRLLRGFPPGPERHLPTCVARRGAGAGAGCLEGGLHC
jgi:hypothetical protein